MNKYWFPCLIASLVMIESAPSFDDRIQFARWSIGAVCSLANLIYVLHNEE